MAEVGDIEYNVSDEPLEVSEIHVPHSSLIKYQKSAYVRSAVHYWIHEKPDLSGDPTAKTCVAEDIQTIFRNHGKTGVNGVPLSRVTERDVDWEAPGWAGFLAAMKKTLTHPFSVRYRHEDRDLKRVLNAPQIITLDGFVHGLHGSSRRLERVLILGGNEGDDIMRVAMSLQTYNMLPAGVDIDVVERDKGFESIIDEVRLRNGFTIGTTFICSFDEFYDRVEPCKQYDLVLAHYSAHHALSSRHGQRRLMKFLSEHLDSRGKFIGCFMDAAGASLLCDPCSEHGSDAIQVMQFIEPVPGASDWGSYIVHVGGKPFKDPVIPPEEVLEASEEYGLLADVFPGKLAPDACPSTYRVPHHLQEVFAQGNELKSVLMVVISHTTSLPSHPYKPPVQTSWRYSHVSLEPETPNVNHGIPLSKADLPYLRAGDYWVGQKTDGVCGVLELRKGANPMLTVRGHVYTRDDVVCPIMGTLQVELVGHLPASIVDENSEPWIGEVWLTDPLFVQHPNIQAFRSRWALARRYLLGHPLGVQFKEWEALSEVAVNRLAATAFEGVIFQQALGPARTWNGIGTSRYWKRVPTIDLYVNSGSVALPVEVGGRWTEVFVDVSAPDGIWEFSVKPDLSLNSPMRRRYDKDKPNTWVHMRNIKEMLSLDEIRVALQTQVIRSATHAVSVLCPRICDILRSEGAMFNPDENTELLAEACALGATYCSRLIFEPSFSMEDRLAVFTLRRSWYIRLLRGEIPVNFLRDLFPGYPEF